MIYDVSINNGEIIIVVDGKFQNKKLYSDFKSWLIVNNYIHFVEIYILDKCGLTSCLNYGISRSKANYIFRIDSGDIWMPNRITKQLYYLDQCYDLVINSTVDSVNTTTKELLAKLYTHNHFIHSSAAFKKVFYDEHYKVCQDYELWLRLISNGSKIKIINESMCIRINTNKGISYKRSYEQIFFTFKIRNLYLRKFNNIYYSVITFFIICLSKIRYLIFKW